MEKLSSSLMFSPSLLLKTSNMRKALQQNMQELTTLTTSDVTKAVRGDYSKLSGIDHSLSRLNAFGAATTELTAQAETMQSAFTLMRSVTQNRSMAIMAVAPSMSSLEVDSFAKSGAREFETLVQTINTNSAGRAVFSGVANDQSPLPSAEVLLTNLETSLAGLTDLAAINTAIDDWFNGATGYASEYLGAAANGPIYIAAGEQADLPVTALDSSIRQTLAGFAKIALLDRGLGSGDVTFRKDMLIGAAEGLLSSTDAQIATAARVGVVQEKLAAAVARNGAELSSLNTLRLGIVGVDPYEAAVRLQEVEARLDSFYTITARLSTLRLVEYLR